jgi:hypothetical protein
VTGDEFEDMDDQERELRNEVMELRKVHMRSFSAAQSTGVISAVKPRISLDFIDNFIDEGILRIVEGMTKVRR